MVLGCVVVASRLAHSFGVNQKLHCTASVEVLVVGSLRAAVTFMKIQTITLAGSVYEI